MISKAKSVTHEHLLSIIHTEARRFPHRHAVRILDVGCGDGNFIAYLMGNLELLNPSITSEIYGFDVYDHGVQQDDFLAKTIDALSLQFPTVPWTTRIASISARERWPFPDEFFDVIISNQVVEHIGDHDMFFFEIQRTLRKNGYSVHLFPLKNYIYETHLNLPFVHKIINHDLLIKYIKFLSRLGLGKYKSHSGESGISLDEYSERHADYMHYFTNYTSYNEVLKLAKKHRLRISFRYTLDLYIRKFRTTLSLNPKYEYEKKRSILIDWLSLFVLKYISIVTLFLEKKEIYRKK